MFHCFRSSFTESAKWAQNESQTKRECSACGKLCRIHFPMPCSSIHPFLWEETQRGCGTTRSLVYGCLWRWLSGAPLLHWQQQQERRWSSAFLLRKILLTLFGSHWIPVFGSRAAQNAWVSHPCCRCRIKGSCCIFLLQWWSDETAQCSLEVGGQSLGQSCFERRMIKELFSFNPFPSKGDSV